MIQRECDARESRHIPADVSTFLRLDMVVRDRGHLLARRMKYSEKIPNDCYMLTVIKAVCFDRFRFTVRSRYSFDCFLARSLSVPVCNLNQSNIRT